MCAHTTSNIYFQLQFMCTCVRCLTIASDSNNNNNKKEGKKKKEYYANSISKRLAADRIVRRILAELKSTDQQLAQVIRNEYRLLQWNRIELSLNTIKLLLSVPTHFDQLPLLV